MANAVHDVIQVFHMSHDRSPWWRRLMEEARTRILLIYVIFMLLVTAIATPVFWALFLSSVNNRVQRDLIHEMESFQETYNQWEALPNQTVADLETFTTEFFAQRIPEDDTFLIVFIDQAFYKSSSRAMPSLLRPNSPLLKSWATLKTPASGKRSTSDPTIDDVLYLAHPLELDGTIRGVFVSVHTTAGERQEALAGVVVFFQVAIGIVIISFALAWFVTGRLLSPVQSLATTARSISESDLNQRITVRGSGEIAELANTFNAMMDRLQNAFVSQRDFINDAGHELRTPITIIRGHLELMGETIQEEQDTLELVIDELDRMSRLVNDMILLAKAERPDFLQLGPIEIEPFARDLFTKIQTLANRQWYLTLQGDGDLVGDRQRLTSALFNLLQNAVQHTQSTDRIELGVVTTEATVRFWVRDTGEGIALEDQHRIFERFARASNRYRRSNGAGLGLAIVEAIVEAHGGQITLNSQLGVGSTFTIILPLNGQSTSVLTSQAPRQSAQLTSNQVFNKRLIRILKQSFLSNHSR